MISEKLIEIRRKSITRRRVLCLHGKILIYRIHKVTIGLMADAEDGPILEEPNKEVDFFDIHSLREAYQKNVSYNAHIISEYKALKLSV